MDAKKIALLVAALLVAGVTAFFAKTMFAADATPTVQAAPIPVKEEGREILVATRTLPVGTIISADSFRYQPWPEDLIENAYYEKGTADIAKLAGTVVRSAVTAGQPLTKGSLVQPGDRGFLAAALGPGMRAVTIITASASTNVAGFVFPGDRVDLVTTYDVQNASGEQGPPLHVSQTIIRNVRVLAVDQNVTGQDADGKRMAKVFSSVTLEVTPKMAEKIAVVSQFGGGKESISLSLRSLADNTAELERAIAAGEVKVPANGDPKAEKEMLIQVASRPTDSDPSYVVGGDVSIFQKRGLSRPSAPRASSPSAPMASYDRPPQPTGPVVKIARGNTVTEVTLGGK
jgi:pilus assembly protein CpaB